MLTTSRGRVKILGCLRGKVPLEGKGNEEGIEECTLILKDMSKVKAGGTMGPPSTAGPTTGTPDPALEVSDTPPAEGQSLGL